ncbi:MAG: hypothetical protein V3T30_03385 [Thermodesulfobacteriota bacterium]
MKFTLEARPPRAVFLNWPMGHPLGEPGNTRQQKKILGVTFAALETIREPGTIIELPYRWRKPEDLEDS